MAPNAETVPNVVITLPDPKGTCRVIIAPIFEAALVQRRLGSSAKVVVSALPATDPHGRPWAADMRSTEFLGGLSAAEARMRAKYDKPGDSVFDAVYGFGQFQEAYRRAQSGEWRPGKAFDYGVAVEPDEEVERRVHPASIAKEAPAEPASTEAPVVGNDTELRPLKLPKALRVALVEAGITTPAKILATSHESLVALPGIGPRSAVQIKDAAQAAAAAELAEDATEDDLASLTE